MEVDCAYEQSDCFNLTYGANDQRAGDSCDNLFVTHFIYLQAPQRRVPTTEQKGKTKGGKTHRGKALETYQNQ